MWRILVMKIAGHGETIAMDTDDGNDRVSVPCTRPYDYVDDGEQVLSPYGRQITFTDNDEIWVDETHETYRRRLANGHSRSPTFDSIGRRPADRNRRSLIRAINLPSAG